MPYFKLSNIYFTHEFNIFHCEPEAAPCKAFISGPNWKNKESNWLDRGFVHAWKKGVSPWKKINVLYLFMCAQWCIRVLVNLKKIFKSTVHECALLNNNKVPGEIARVDKLQLTVKPQS